MTDPRIVVLLGGVSAERDVSLHSGRSVVRALQDSFPVFAVDLQEADLPPGMFPERDVIFPGLHGTFGEDGAIQSLLEQAGFAYVGCDAEASRLCIDKAATRAVAAAEGVRIAAGTSFDRAEVPEARSLVQNFGTSLVVKPVDQGSSVHLFFIEGEAQLGDCLKDLPNGRWLVEQRVRGRELTIGLLDGKAMGIVEVRPKSGVYDYASKYTSGASEYLFPASLPEAVRQRIEADAEQLFRACGCRDFARIDFLLPDDGEAVFLEINTLPGMTPTSLLPKSAQCVGLDYAALVRRMIQPALGRFGQRTEVEKP